MPPAPLRRAPGARWRRLPAAWQACLAAALLAAALLAAGHQASQALGAFAAGAAGVLRPGAPRAGVARASVVRRAQRAFSVALGSELTGKVTKVWPQGAYLDLGLDVPGLLHVSKLDPAKAIKSAEDELAVGDELKVWLVRYDKPQVEVWRFPPAATHGQQLTGKVTDVTDGVYLDLGLDRRGVLPKRQMKRPGEKDKLSVGDEVTVWVTDVRQTEVEVRSWKGDFDVGFETQGTVASLNKKGAFVKLPGKVKGYLPCSQMAVERVEKPVDKVQIGEEVTVKVIGMDRKAIGRPYEIEKGEGQKSFKIICLALA